MLWKNFDLEIEEHCVTSANLAREQLTQLLNNPEIGAELERRIKTIQASLRSFIDEVGDPDGDHSYHQYNRGYGTDRLSMALGRLRALVGVQLGRSPLSGALKSEMTWPRSCRMAWAGSSSGSTLEAQTHGSSQVVPIRTFDFVVVQHGDLVPAERWRS